MAKQVKDQSSIHRYRTEIPNIIDDMDLSVYAFRLYVRLKRVAGDDGKCFYSTRELAQQCRMSMGAISKAKQDLVDADLIRIERAGDWERDNITIVDMWPANFAYFAKEKEETPCSPHEQTEQPTCSPHEQPVHHMNTPCSPHERNKEELVKEEPIKEEPKGESAPAAKPRELHSRNAVNGASRKIRFESPHVVNSRFDTKTCYIPEGHGVTAVEIFYERFDVCNNEQRLTAPMEDDLVRHCPDLDKLRDVIIAYDRAGFKNKRNVQLILDWYRHGIPDKYGKTSTAPKSINNGINAVQDYINAKGLFR